MDRVVVLWTRPFHLRDEEVERWARDEARRLGSIPAVRATRLSSVAPASSRHSRPWDWMLELHLAEAADAAACADHPICASWLHELRVLGTQPTVILAHQGVALDDEDR